MTYNSQELSIEDGSPYYLYEFTTPNSVFYYTDFPISIDWNGFTWLPFPIKHSEIKQSGELSKNNLTVSIPIDGDLANLYVGWSPDHTVSFTLRRGHFGADDTLVYWKGRVASHNLKSEILELKCESIFTSMRRPGIRARFQRNCRHAVYSSQCRAVKETFATNGGITSVSGLTLTIPEASSQVNDWFTGGFLELSDGSLRMIVTHTGDQVTISRVSRYIVDTFPLSGYGINYGAHYGGLSVILYPGCDRTVATCKDKFNNLDNQGGFKWIPTKNPMGGSSII